MVTADLEHTTGSGRSAEARSLVGDRSVEEVATSAEEVRWLITGYGESKLYEYGKSLELSLFRAKIEAGIFTSLARKQGEMARSDLQGSMKLSRLSSFPIKEKEESESGIRLSAFV